MKKTEHFIFLGSKNLGLAIFKKVYEISNKNWSIVHPNDSSDSRSDLENFRDYAEKNGIPFFIANNGKEAQKIIEKINPNIGLVCGWYWLIKEETLEAIPGGLWGIHNSLLPKYRGGSPLVWSIINGEKTVGSSVFKLTKGMDEGDILHQVEIHLSPEHDIQYALQEIEKKLLETLPEQWNALVMGKAVLKLQNQHEATYCGSRTPLDGHIDWSWSAERVHNFVRAQTTPYPGAFTYSEGQKTIIRKTRALSEVYFGTPGQIIFITSEGIIISCGGNTALCVIDVEIGHNIEKASHLFKSVKQRFVKSDPLQ